jgi:hypothetical protein
MAAVEANMELMAGALRGLMQQQSAQGQPIKRVNAKSCEYVDGLGFIALALKQVPYSNRSSVMSSDMASAGGWRFLECA